MSDNDQPTLFDSKDDQGGGQPSSEERATALLPITIESKMSQAYLEYAMSVIVSRALPDVRDGLKPVHRRILYAMRSLGLGSKSKYRKSALVVGEVLGKYHPHGDTAVYNSMVRMAQDFSMRHILVDGQGNFGSVDGDSPAAMRYTECRLAKISDELLLDIEKKTVDFVDNYDGSIQEPVVLPAKLPNLLLNGSAGIAVGMATNIPPHNLNEVIDAVVRLINEPDCIIEDLLQHIQGPDFPTRGMIYNWNDIITAYTTGRGSVVMRGKCDIEEIRSGKQAIIITEIPYQVNKANLVANIAELVKAKKVKGITEIRDESDRNGMRVVVEIRRDYPAQAVLNGLYKYTPLQTTFPFNMVALVNGKEPQLLNLKDILQEYIKHRKEVIVRRTKFNLERAEARAHILEGLTIALDNLDKVIETIKKSKTAEDASIQLQKAFKLSEIQARAILDMQLRRLAALERLKIEEEYKEVKALIKDLKSILADDEKVKSILKEELAGLKKEFGEERKTKVFKHGLSGDWNPEDFIPNERTVVTITRSGYIKRLSPDTYRRQRRGGKGVIGMSTKEEDVVSDIFTTKTHDKLLFFSNRGRVFKLPVYEVPEVGRTAKGQPIINLVQIEAGELITAVLPLSKKIQEAADKYFVFMATEKGTVKKTALSDFDNIRKTGIRALTIREDDQLRWTKLTQGESEVMMVTSAGQAIRFSEKNVRSMGRTAAGVRGIRLRPEDVVVEMDVIDTMKNNLDQLSLLVILENGFGKKTRVREYKVQNRGGVGIKTANVTKKTGSVVGSRLIDKTVEDVIIITKGGQIIRIPLKGMRNMGRVTQGVTVIRMKKDRVAAFSCMREEQDEEGGEEDKEKKDEKKDEKKGKKKKSK